MEARIISVVYLLLFYEAVHIKCFDNAQVLHTGVLFQPVRLKCCHGAGAGTKWIFNQQLLYIDNSLFDERRLDNTVLLPDKSLFIEHVSLNHGGTYDCICSSSSVVRYYLQVEAPPQLYIIANYSPYNIREPHLYLPQTQIVSLQCSANGSRPEVNLTLTVDDDVFATSEATLSHGMGFNQTFDTTVAVSKEVIRGSGNISCKSNGLGYYSNAQITLQYISYGR